MEVIKLIPNKENIDIVATKSFYTDAVHLIAMKDHKEIKNAIDALFMLSNHITNEVCFLQVSYLLSDDELEYIRQNDLYFNHLMNMDSEDNRKKLFDQMISNMGYSNFIASDLSFIESYHYIPNITNLIGYSQVANTENSYIKYTISCNRKLFLIFQAIRYDVFILSTFNQYLKHILSEYNQALSVNATDVFMGESTIIDEKIYTYYFIQSDSMFFDANITLFESSKYTYEDFKNGLDISNYNKQYHNCININQDNIIFTDCGLIILYNGHMKRLNKVTGKFNIFCDDKRYLIYVNSTIKKQTNITLNKEEFLNKLLKEDLDNDKK